MELYLAACPRPLPAKLNFRFTVKIRYKLTAEAYQTIFDGEQSKFKKENAIADANVKEENLEVNLYALRDRVNQVFFGVLLIDEQLKQNTLQQKDVQNGIDKTQALVDNGTAYKSSVDELKAQMLQTVTGQGAIKQFAQVISFGTGLINQPKPGR